MAEGLHNPSYEGSWTDEYVVPRGRRLAAVASQLSVFGCQLLIPAIVRFTVGREDPFVKQWSSEALNLHILWLVPWIAMIPLLVTSQSGVVAVVAIGWFEVGAIYALIVGCMGAVKAWRGEVWQYPVNLRLIRDR